MMTNIKTKILNFFNHGIDNETMEAVDIALMNVNKKQRKGLFKKIKSAQKTNPNKLKLVLSELSSNKRSLYFLDGFISGGSR